MLNVGVFGIVVFEWRVFKIYIVLIVLWLFFFEKVLVFFFDNIEFFFFSMIGIKFI